MLLSALLHVQDARWQLFCCSCRRSCCCDAAAGSGSSVNSAGNSVVHDAVAAMSVSPFVWNAACIPTCSSVVSLLGGLLLLVRPVRVFLLQMSASILLCTLLSLLDLRWRTDGGFLMVKCLFLRLLCRPVVCLLSARHFLCLRRLVRRFFLALLASWLFR